MVAARFGRIAKYCSDNSDSNRHDANKKQVKLND
jgi:hypothetical protein